MAFSQLVISIFLISFLCNDAAGAIVDNTCYPAEREVLLLLKRSVGVSDDLSSWVGIECCRNWTRVTCDNRTGHVVKLDVFNPEGVAMAPPQIGNLTHLEYLSLSGFRIEGGWIARLTSLKQLFLWNTDLQKAPDLIYNLNMLPFISRLHFEYCDVLIPKSLPHVNFTHLYSLVIDMDSRNVSLPYWLFNITTLTTLIISSANVSGSIPSAIGNLCNLEWLQLDYNELSGVIPETLGGLRQLSSISLVQNKLTGSIPSSLGNLTSLTSLDLSYNALNGSIPGSYFNSLHKLSVMDLSGNPLEIRFASGWNPPFQLEYLRLASCKVGPSFPRWIRTQTGLTHLRLSDSGISGILPTWLWDLSSMYEMDISGNNLSGSLPSKLLKFQSLDHLSLANNHIEGPLPQFKNANDLSVLLLSNNSFSGRIPFSYCELKDLDTLDLSMNHLSGRIPLCLQEMDGLIFLNLARNKLDGSIEGLSKSFCELQIVALSDNSFSGDFPSSLRRCDGLTVLDIGQNNFSGNLPTWIVASLPMLSVLIVRSNNFYGEIPHELHLLSKLQILDLSGNKFSGSIPHGFWNFSAMKEPSTFNSTKKSFASAGYLFIIDYSAFITIKGQWMEYSRLVLELMVVIDLSSNELSGEIPREINNLLGLKSLNLSRNHLTGNIPDNIGALKNVESLDLSFNNLDGEIPESILGMAFLSQLNLSFNNLSGKIPSGSQFSTFKNSSYIRNAGLCGTPLLKLCDDSEIPNGVPSNRTDEMHDDRDSILFLVLSAASGFIFGFWAFYGTLLFKRTWGYAYFKVIDNTLDKIYEAIKKSHSQPKERGNHT